MRQEVAIWALLLAGAVQWAIVIWLQQDVVAELYFTHLTLVMLGLWVGTWPARMSLLVANFLLATAAEIASGGGANWELSRVLCMSLALLCSAAVMFGIPIAFVAGWLAYSDMQLSLASNASNGAPWQFSLRSLLMWTIVAAMVLALGRATAEFHRPSVTFVLFGNFAWSFATMIVLLRPRLTPWPSFWLMWTGIQFILVLGVLPRTSELECWSGAAVMSALLGTAAVLRACGQCLQLHPLGPSAFENPWKTTNLKLDRFEERGP